MTTGVDVREPVRFFLERFGLTDRTLEQIVGGAIARRADYADLYFEFRTVEALGLEDGIVKTASQHVSQGVGVRVVGELCVPGGEKLLIRAWGESWRKRTAV